jgi:PEP-CTERM motif
MMLRYGLGALAMAMAMGAPPARADVIRVFEATGVFDDGVKLGGTLTIDVTTGNVTAADLLLGEPISAEVTGLGGKGVNGGGFSQMFLSLGPASPLPLITLGFLTPSLVAYGGGPLASDAAPQGALVSTYAPPSGAEFVDLASGTLTSSTLTVPEPSTWSMMLMGFAGLGFAGYRASRKMAAAATYSPRRLTPGA